LTPDIAFKARPYAERIVDNALQFYRDIRFDDSISQLRLAAHFQPSPELRAIQASNHWCESPAELPAFEQFIRGSAAFDAVSQLTPGKVSLVWGKV